jgi:hypothetical protein
MCSAALQGGRKKPVTQTRDSVSPAPDLSAIITPTFTLSVPGDERAGSGNLNRRIGGVSA